MSSSAFERAQRQGAEAVRTAVLDAASRLLSAEGPQALALRRIAADVGCSTTVLYRAFGGKAGLAEALYAEGFERFRRRLEAVPTDPDPRLYLADLARAYRDNALLERNYYGLMFGNPIPGFQPSDEALGNAAATYSLLENAVASCAAAGHLVDADTRGVAATLWAGLHGFVSLELAGHLPDANSVLETFLRVTASGFLITTPTGVINPPTDPGAPT